MVVRYTRIFITTVFILFLFNIKAAPKTKVELAGKDIPRLYYVSNILLSGSDSLYLNGQLLLKGEAYKYNPQPGFFDLSKLVVTENDTLVIIYFEMPAWLLSVYGESLPEVVSEI